VANLRESYALNRGQVRGLGVFLPAIGGNYLLFQVSLEWHYQKALFDEGSRLHLTPKNRRQRHLVRAFDLFRARRRIRGAYHYVRAALL
jgi:hypothetical protein